MLIFISTIVTIFILSVLLGIFLVVERYCSCKDVNKINTAMNATFYCFIMFSLLMIYIFFIIYFQGINSLLSALLLLLTVWGANYISRKCLNLEGISKCQRKILVLVAIIEIAIVFFVFWRIEHVDLYLEYLCVDLAIIVGFVISLDSLLEKNPKKIFLIIVSDLNFNEVSRLYTIIPLLCVNVLIAIAFVITELFPEEKKIRISRGIVIGMVLFIAIIIVVIYTLTKKKTSEIEEKQLDKK